MTHKELVDAAYRWLTRKDGNCRSAVGFAFKELKSLSDEIPDVIAFNSWESILIECKASRSDFLSDKKKPHRKKGMGNWRFYCCPTGMIKKEELPERWGLLYVNEAGKVSIEYDCRTKRINEGWPQEWMKKEYPKGYIRTITADENKFDPDHNSERAILYTALRRLNIRGRLSEIYKAPE